MPPSGNETSIYNTHKLMIIFSDVFCFGETFLLCNLKPILSTVSDQSLSQQNRASLGFHKFCTSTLWTEIKDASLSPLPCPPPQFLFFPFYTALVSNTGI